MRSVGASFAARVCVCIAVVALLFSSRVAVAHEVPQSVVMLDVGWGVVDAKVSLPLGELEAALSLPLVEHASDALQTHEPTITRYITDHVRATNRAGLPFEMRIASMEIEHTNNPDWQSNDWLVAHLAFAPPHGTSVDFFDLNSDLISHRVVSHEVVVYVRHDLRSGLIGQKPQLVGVLGFGSTHVRLDRSSSSWWAGFKHFFVLGMRHIAEGADHLLFLLVLLLPAPWIASAGRWTLRKATPAAFRSVVMIAGGFTVGHSITLGLATAGLVHIPSRGVEVAIAVSIFVASIHAWRPLFSGREVWIASGFGLVHGLAFATTLAGLNFDGATLTLGLLGFNLGIEWMQLLVIAVTLPILFALSETPGYPYFRIAGAAFGMGCAVYWILVRAFGVANALEPYLEKLADPPRWFVISTGVASVLSALLLFRRALSRRVARVGE